MSPDYASAASLRRGGGAVTRSYITMKRLSVRHPSTATKDSLDELDVVEVPSKYAALQRDSFFALSIMDISQILEAVAIV